MLKPFRIKELNDPAFDGDLPRSAKAESDQPALGLSDIISAGTYREVSSSLPRTSNDGVVRITEYEYEETISNNPEAKLSYLDEDDGEVVTVGSSLELKQRLDDPLPSFSPRSHLPGHAKDEFESMHIFDIRNSASVVDTWRGYQARLSEEHGALRASPLAHNNTLNPDGSLPCESPAREAESVDWGDKSKSPLECWTTFCNPPRASLELGLVEPEYKGDDYLHELNQGQKEVPKPITIPCPPNPISNSGASSPSLPITEEGKKQAQAAGKKLRDSRNIYQLKSTPLFDAPSKTDNFWSSYQQLGSSEPLSQREPDSDESPIEEKGQPLLTAFESELSKLMKGNEKPEITAKTRNLSLDISSITETHVEPTPSPNASSTEHRAASPDLFGQAFQALIGRITQVTSELTSRLPEVEQRLSSVQEQIPLHMQATVQDTIKAMGCHVQTLSGIMQHATVTARSATSRTMEAENLFTSQVTGLRTLADELRQIGQRLLEVFEANGRQQASNNSQDDGPSGTSMPSSSSASPSNVEHELNNENEPTISNVSQDVHVETSTESQAMLSPPMLAKASSILPFERSEARSPDEPEDSSQDILLVSNLSSHTTEEKLTTTLANKGFLGTVSLSRDSSTQKHLGFGTIKFPSPYAASGALKALTGARINGKTIDIEFLEGPTADQPEESHRGKSSNPASGSLALEHKEPLKTRPSVTFDVVDNPTSNSGLRRAKSLGALRSHRAKRDGHHNPPQLIPDSHPRQRPFDHHRPNRCVMRKRSMQGPNALLDQQDNNPDLSVRYPSLLNSKITGSVPFHNPDSKFGMEPVGSRYLGSGSAAIPPLEQIDGPSRSQTIAPAPPTLHGDGPSLYSGFPEFSAYAPPPPPVPDKLPGSWPWEYESQKWDMLGRPRGPSDDVPVRRAKTTISRKQAQKPRVEVTPSSLYDNPWAARTTQRQQHGGELPSAFLPKQQQPEGETTHLHRNGAAMPRSIPILPGTFPSESQTPATAQNKPSPKIEACVKDLQTLGFESEGGQHITRLRVFSEAANGRLEEAIEMIEEERKAYEERSRFC